MIFPAVIKAFGKEKSEQIDKAIKSRGKKIMPLAVLLIVLTGGMMMSTWVGSNAGGYFTTNLQKLFMLKVFLAVLIVLGIIISLATKKEVLGGHFHKVVLILGFLIVVLAKVMFIV